MTKHVQFKLDLEVEDSDIRLTVYKVSWSDHMDEFYFMSVTDANTCAEQERPKIPGTVTIVTVW